jgi:hypothetical protein
MTLNCWYCGREIQADEEGNICVGWIPEIQSTTVDMPYCNDDCFTKMKLKHRTIRPETKKEKEWMTAIITKEKLEEFQRHKEYLKKIEEEMDKMKEQGK